MIQWIKDNKTFMVLTIIAILLAIIIMLMISGNSQPVNSLIPRNYQPVSSSSNSYLNGEADISITGSNVTIAITPTPVIPIPPEMRPKPSVTSQGVP